MGEENKTRDAIDAVTGLAQAVPVYQDIIQPAAKEIGTGLQTVAKTVHLALAPVAALVWGYDQIKEFVSTKVVEKLKNVPPENIAAPAANIAGPALDALRYTGHQEELSDMYANLLASAMNKDTAKGAHPAFVEIIKQLTPDEARIIKLFNQAGKAFPIIDVVWMWNPSTGKSGGNNIIVNFALFGKEAGCEFPDMTPAYINNICRLGLADVPIMGEYTAPGIYEPLVNDPFVASQIDRFKQNSEVEVSFDKKGLFITPLGRLFASRCTTQSEA